MNRKVLLMILDGWGEGKHDHSNAIYTQGAPFIDSLRAKYPMSHLQACGEYVGLPDGQMGNSEVGHMNLGAGRVVYQDLVKINMACRDHKLLDNKEIRAAYDYVRDGFQYLRRNFYDLGETGWEVEEALTMLSTGRGNCYNYAAAFWALARGLGYDAQAISGTMGWDYERHGWVVIYDESGTRLTYDTETEMAYRRDGVYNRDMFAMSPAFAAGWNYKYGA